MRSLPFCTALASWNVAPWAEALVRSLGNDQARGKGSSGVLLPCSCERRPQ